MLHKLLLIYGINHIKSFATMATDSRKRSQDGGQFVQNNDRNVQFTLTCCENLDVLARTF
jgi:hypothetical protein